MKWAGTIVAALRKADGAALVCIVFAERHQNLQHRHFRRRPREPKSASRALPRTQYAAADELA